MAGFLTAPDMYICHPGVTDNTKMFQHALVWWSEKALFVQYYSTERKAPLCPGCRSFWVHLLGALNFLYLCISFLLWFGEVFAMETSAFKAVSTRHPMRIICQSLLPEVLSSWRRRLRIRRNEPLPSFCSCPEVNFSMTQTSGQLLL